MCRLHSAPFHVGDVTNAKVSETDSQNTTAAAVHCSAYDGAVGMDGEDGAIRQRIVVHLGIRSELRTWRLNRIRKVRTAIGWPENSVRPMRACICLIKPPLSLHRDPSRERSLSSSTTDDPAVPASHSQHSTSCRYSATIMHCNPVPGRSHLTPHPTSHPSYPLSSPYLSAEAALLWLPPHCCPWVLRRRVKQGEEQARNQISVTRVRVQ